MSAANIDTLMDLWALSMADLEGTSSAPFTSHSHMHTIINASLHGDVHWQCLATLAAVLCNRSFHSSVVGWVEDFLSDCKVCLKFNSYIAEERGQPIGVPQGSPLSPILLALYTSPLLELSSSWTGSTLGMYVNDGLIFCCSPSWVDVVVGLTAHYLECVEWLQCSGLATKPAKTECLFFQWPGEWQPAPWLELLHLMDPVWNVEFVVNTAPLVQYLGFFIHFKQDWEPHMCIMCNWAQASLRALSVCGNTERGLCLANWHLVYNAMCLPVLSYGCQLWWTSPKWKCLLNMLQVVQNEGVKVLMGAFWTTPHASLHAFAHVLPFHIFVDKLISCSVVCLYNQLCLSQLLRQLGSGWRQPLPGDLPLPQFQAGRTLRHWKSVSRLIHFRFTRYTRSCHQVSLSKR